MPVKQPHHQPLAREEIARIEVGRTAVTGLTARVLIGFFLAAIVLVPAYETAGLARAGEWTTSAWSHLLRMPGRVIGVLAGAGDSALGAGGGWALGAGGAWTRLIAANRVALAEMNAFEDALEDEARIGRLLRPPAQRLLSEWLGAGNERVYVGREGWLFYRPDVEYATGPGFLSPRQLARRAAAASEWETPVQPDPRLAIRRFKLELDAWGITLIVVPTPVKPTVHPERLSARLDGAAPVQNPSYTAFVEDLRRDGILVFDPAPALVEARRRDGPQYLATDTHWRPAAMEAVAAGLAAFVREHVALAPAPDPGYRVDPREVRHEGDTLAMLDLPAAQTRYPPETVQVRRVLDDSGAPWRPARGTDALLLGDSFANIYSIPTLGWGDAAGLAEHLSLRLGRPLDRLVQNDEGAFATRAMLARVAATDPDRLARTRLVIWQFATRELAFGDWRILGAGD